MEDNETVFVTQKFDGKQIKNSTMYQSVQKSTFN